MLPVNELINNRSDPGILIFNLKSEITFANQIAWDILNGESSPKHPLKGHGTYSLPDNILPIYDDLKQRLNRFAWNSCPDSVYLKKVVTIGASSFLIRAFIVSDKNKGSSTHFLLLIEKSAARSRIDVERARVHYHLSLREFQVVQLLVGGLTNKEIANQLKIAEPTVKDHMHKITGKVGASTRCGIVSQVLSLADGDAWKANPGEKKLIAPT